MAFCPHCGKNVTDQATKCLACSKELKPIAPAGVKFKGTMMMQAPAPQAAATPEVPAPAAAQPAPPAAPPPAAAAPAAKPSEPKLSLKGTMIGGMGAAAVPPTKPAAPAPAPPAAAPAAPAPQRPPVADTPSSGEDVDDAGHFLVGDPMAPPEEAAPAPRPNPALGYTPPNTAQSPEGNGRILMVAVTAMAVMAAIAAAVARQMGLF